MDVFIGKSSNVRWSTHIYIYIYISLDDWLPVGINKVASYLSKYDGGTDLDFVA